MILKGLMIVVAAAFYAITGITLQVNEVIVEPAYWSMYGYFWGVVMLSIISWGSNP